MSERLVTADEARDLLPLYSDPSAGRALCNTVAAQAERIAALERELAAARATLRDVDRREGWR